MLPSMCATIWSRVGFYVFASSSAACMIWPDWQEPHCGTCSAIQAFCKGCELVGDRPSMVVTFLPAASDMLVWQERTALPSTCTVQAPHRPDPQPNLVPVSFRCSRTTHSSGVSGSTSTLAAFPLIVNPTGMSPSPMVLSIGSIITGTLAPAAGFLPQRAPPETLNDGDRDRDRGKAPRDCAGG